MIADLKPYPDYKESGLPWLGQVPNHWEIKRAKSIFQRVDERSTTGKEELLTAILNPKGQSGRQSYGQSLRQGGGRKGAFFSPALS